MVGRIMMWAEEISCATSLGGIGLTLQLLNICLVTHVVARLQVLKHPNQQIAKRARVSLHGLNSQLVDPRPTDIATRRTLLDLDQSEGIQLEAVRSPLDWSKRQKHVSR
jgi:hypothetical protein